MMSSPPMEKFEHKYWKAKDFEAQMLVVKWRAMAAAAAHQMSRYLGIFGLTWATVVVLGAFAPNLRTIDIAMVGTLLLLQAVRFVASSTFGRLPSARLFSEQYHPDHFTNCDYQYYWASRIHAAGQIWSSSIAFAAIAASVFRLACTGHVSLSAYHGSTDTTNIVSCLVTFYSLTIATSFFALVATALHFMRFFRLSPSSAGQQLLLDDRSAVAFYDAVYHCAIESDLYTAFGMSVLNFAFDKLRSDHVRGIQPLVIKVYNDPLVKYIYNVPTGVEMAYHHLRDSDMYRQLVAVNLLRFWVKEKRMERQIAYFEEVGRQLDRPEKMAEAASYAIEQLADSWADYSPNWRSPAAAERNGRMEIEMDQKVLDVEKERKYPGRHPFLEAQIDKSTKTTIVDFLAVLVIKPLRTSLTFQLRALESCCRSRGVVDWIQGKDYHEQLRVKLLSVVTGESENAKQRTRIYAASTLFHLLKSPPPSPAAADPQLLLTDLKNSLERVHPADGSEKYVWKKEKELLDCLRKELGLEAYEWRKLKIKDPDDLESLQNR